MRAMNEVNNGCHNNWLCFSLSPHMNMEVANDHQQHHHHQQQNVLPPTSFFLSSPHELNNTGICYDSALSVMPLKSDGSLCLMEALSRSHPGMVPSSAPKLEDFLGGATIGYTHQIHPYYSGLVPCFELYNQPPFETATKNNTQLLEQITQNGGGGRVNQQQMNNNMVEQDGGGNMGYGDLQTLSLSMSPGSQSSCVTVPSQVGGTDSVVAAGETRKRAFGQIGVKKQTVHRKSIETFGQRTSQFRGVTRHRWTGRYEAHLWDNSVKKEGQTRKGRQVYLGGYDMEEKAAKAYDLAALKYWGPSTHLNFPLENYRQELEEMKNMTRQEHVAHLRRKSSGFSRGASIYRGVTRHHQHGRWQARIGRVAGNKDLYLGTFSTQEEAAEAYDIAAIKFRGANAVTNFEVTRYDVQKIMASDNLLAGEMARRSHETEANRLQALCYDNHSTHNNRETDKPANEFSKALENLISMDSVNSSQQTADASGKIGTHFSASSSVTSLSSLRAGSPDKSRKTTIFEKHFLAPKFLDSSASFSSLFTSAKLKPAPAVPSVQLPVFAAWTDS